MWQKEEKAETSQKSLLSLIPQLTPPLHIYLQIDRLWKDRLEHPIVNAEITKFMDKTWMVKEQTEINQSW